MISLVIAGVVLALATLGLLAWPLWKPQSAQIERQQQEGLRDRLLAQLKDFDGEEASGAMDAQVATTERSRLEYQLAQALKVLEGMPAPQIALGGISRKQAWIASAVLVLVLPVAAGLMYWRQNRAAIETFASAQPADPAIAGQPLPPMVMQMVGRLEKRLQAQPNDPKGWAQLGRSYGVLNRTDDALRAYAKAYEQAPNDLDIVSDYAWVAYSVDPRKPQPLAVTLYRKLFTAEPNNQDALWVLGLAAYHAGNIKEAQQMWHTLLATLPPGTPAEQGVRSALEQLEKSATPKR